MAGTQKVALWGERYLTKCKKGDIIGVRGKSCGSGMLLHNPKRSWHGSCRDFGTTKKGIDIGKRTP